ncbi:MAG: MTH1187 family thiamine-binding protein [Candidatus Zixiibacteriota bacterium]
MLVSFSIFPVGRATSLSKEVAKIIDIIDKSGLKYKTSAMSTTIEGDWDEIMAVINKCRLKLRQKNDRVYLNLVMDDRKGARNRLTGKIDSLEKKLKREISK